MKSQLQSAMRQAMKDRDKLRLDMIRSLMSAIQYQALESGVKELPEAECHLVFQREIKKKRETLEFAEKGDRAEMITEIGKQIAIIEEFLPQQLSEAELKELLNGWKGGGEVASIGDAMKRLKQDHAGTYDAKLASTLAKELF